MMKSIYDRCLVDPALPPSVRVVLSEQQPKHVVKVLRTFAVIVCGPDESLVSFTLLIQGWITAPVPDHCV